MAESSLSIAYYELANRVGRFLGYPNDLIRLSPKGLTKSQEFQRGRLRDVLTSGLRQFYFPPVVQGMASPTSWSFMHPTGTVVLPVGANKFQLPDDFGGIEGRVTLAPSQSQVWWPLEVRNESAIRAMFAAFPETTSRPQMVAVAPLVGTGATEGQRFEMVVWPAADQQYELQFQYYLLPDALDGSKPYAYGGAAHAETLLESCLAIAEQMIDDMPGVHTAKFQERLIASIGMDQKFKAQNLGYNRDNSDRRGSSNGPWWHYGGSWTFQGTQY
jgi:hypothetical protein